MNNITIYVPSSEQKKKIFAIADKLETNVSKMMLTAFDYWLMRNPKQISQMAHKYHGTHVIQEVKETESVSGDFLGSFEKEQNKIKRIMKAKRSGEISVRLAAKLIKMAKSDYESTRRHQLNRLTGSSKQEVKLEKSITYDDLKVDTEGLELAEQIWKQDGSDSAKKFLYGTSKNPEDTFLALKRRMRND